MPSNPTFRLSLSILRVPHLFVVGPFLLALLLSGCGRTAPSPAAAMERILQADHQAFLDLRHFTEIVPRMRTIDLEGCPSEFRSAYLAHIHAWEDVEKVLREIEQLSSTDNQSAIFWESAIRGFFGDIFTIPARILEQAGELDQRYAAAQQQVEITYRRLEELAVSQGAKLPPRAVPPTAPQQ